MCLRGCGCVLVWVGGGEGMGINEFVNEGFVYMWSQITTIHTSHDTASCMLIVATVLIRS